MVFQGKLRYLPLMQANRTRECVSGTIHGHWEKTSWVGKSNTTPYTRPLERAYTKYTQETDLK